MIRTIFVDDEAGVLEGLENRLRRLRRRWKMEFALSADEALSRLKRGQFDAIVTDMRMPGMDGAALLARVREEFPGMVRIVLSGQTAREQLLRALPLAHQILAKPCDVDAIEEAVERARLLQATLHAPEMGRLLAEVKHLPSVPRLYLEVSRRLEETEVDVARVAEPIAEDPAMTARLLQLVNSGLLGLRRKVTSVPEAATYLGLEELRSLVLSLEVFQALSHSPDIPMDELEALQVHALRTARLAASIAPEGTDRRDAFCAGILHDIGRLVTLCQTDLPQPSTCADGQPSEAQEREAMGFSHAEVGGALLSLWGLPTSIVEAVVFHHSPSASGSRSFGVLGAVHVANAVVSARARTRGDLAVADCQFDEEFLEQAPADELDLEALLMGAAKEQVA